jgi:16S rRNA processing protein RimM
MTSCRTNGKSEQIAGSPNSGEPEFLVVGKIRKPHGLHGELTMEVLTDFPERLSTGMEVFIGEEHKPVHIRSLRWHNQLLLIAFNEYHDPEKAGECRNQFVSISSLKQPELSAGEYYHHQIVGLNVYKDDGALLGVIENILETGANDVMIIRSLEGVEILLPAIDSVINDINMEKGEMRVHILPGMLPD